MDLYVFILLILAAILAAKSVFLMKKRYVRGVKPFIVCALLVAIWNVMDATDILLMGLNSKVILFGIKMSIIVYIPAFWLMTIMELTDRRSFTNRRNILLIIFPAITSIVILTALNGNWYANGFFLKPAGKYDVLGFNKGFWLWINAGYNYFVNFMSIALLINAAFSKQYARKKQAGIMLFSMLFPVATDILYVGNVNIYNNLDVTSISFCSSLIISIYGIYKYKLLDIVLVARERAFEDMDDVMIVLDDSKNIVDMNRKAVNIFNINICDVIGRPISELITQVKNYDFEELKDTTLKMRFNYGTEEGTSNYHGSISKIKGNGNYTIGYLILLYDTTELTITQNKLKQANNELRELNEKLYEESIKDELTKVYNKRHITMLLKKEMEEAKKYSNPFTIAIIDIDYFKQFNDKYGHLIGDKVLEKVAELVSTELECNGKTGRFGGEEFLILMQNTDLETGYEICERIRSKISKCEFEYECMPITISAGITELRDDDNMNTLIKRADDCLYSAKGNGRNRIEATKIVGSCS